MSNADQSAFSIRTLGRITRGKCVWREGFFVGTCLSHESLSLSLKLLAFLPLPSRGPQETPTPLAPMPFLPNNHPLCSQHYSFISDQFLHSSGPSDFAKLNVGDLWCLVVAIETPVAGCACLRKQGTWRDRSLYRVSHIAFVFHLSGFCFISVPFKLLFNIF